MSSRFALASVTLALLHLARADCPSALRAQETPAAGGPARLAAAVSALRPGARVRVHAAGQFSAGRFRPAGPDSLVLSDALGEWATPLRAVDTLWVQRRSPVHGAVVGGVIGAALGTLFTYGLAAGLNESATDTGCGDDCRQVFTVGIGVGGGSGALVGAGLGSLVRRWHRRYP